MLNNLMENLKAMNCDPVKIDGNTVKINAPIVPVQETKRVIWSNIDLNVDDWRDGYAEYCEINNIEYDENEIINFMHETNNLYLDDERANLNVKLDGNIIVFASLGLWNGRHNAHAIISNNMQDILNCTCDMMEFFADGENIRARSIHHDGENLYLYRYLRNDLGRDKIETFYNKLYAGEITADLIDKYTKSLYPIVSDIYGW